MLSATAKTLLLKVITSLHAKRCQIQVFWRLPKGFKEQQNGKAMAHT